MTARPAGALLLTGAYGVGKTAVLAEIASILEAAGKPFAAIDLDWLVWANVPDAGHHDPRLLARNLAAVVRIDREAGVQLFVLAGAVRDADALATIRAAVGSPLTVVRVTAPIALVEARLAPDPTIGRADDLAEARAWLAAGVGEGLEDAVAENSGPLRDAALAAIAAAGWDVGVEPSHDHARQSQHDEPRLIADAEVRANGGEIVYRGQLRVDDPHWPAEAARLHRGLRIRDLADPDPKSWVVLIFPDGSVRLCAHVARSRWFTGG